MSKENFTKGPWMIAPESGTFVYALGPQGTNVFWCDVQAAGKERASSKECAANTHLIAAAPELYEALEQAVTSMLDSGHSGSSVVVKSAKAALAKARGEV